MPSSSSSRRRQAAAARSRQVLLSALAAITLLLGLGSGLGWVLWVLPDSPPPHLARVAILVDRSETAMPQDACAAAGKVALSELSNPREEVHLMLYFTDDGSRKGPPELGATVVRPRVELGEGGDPLARPNARVLADLEAACSPLAVTLVSPLVPGLLGMLGDLRDPGTSRRTCDSENTRCVAAFITDGLGEVDPHLKAALDPKLPQPAEDATPIPWQDLDRLLICGLGQRQLSAKSKGTPVDRVESAWRARIDPTSKLATGVEITNTCIPTAHLPS